jgi:Na+/H+-dicarboxylate symporter
MFGKVKAFFSKHKSRAKAMVASMAIACMCALGGVTAFAVDESATSVRTQIKTSASDMSDQIVGVVGDVLPYAIAVMTAVLVVSVGINVVRKLMTKSSH